MQGKDTEPWEFWLDLEVPRSHYEDNELIDIAITGNREAHGQCQHPHNWESTTNITI